jgi:hypothetical protein
MAAALTEKRRQYCKEHIHVFWHVNKGTMNESTQNQERFMSARRACVQVQKEGPQAISPAHNEMYEDRGFTIPFAKSPTRKILQLRWHVSV